MRARTTEDARTRAVLNGNQLEREIRLAMPAADIHSMSELARRSSVQRDTLYAWFRGERPPKSATLEKVASALHVRLGDLWDYERQDDGPPPLISPELLEEIRVAVAAGVAEGVARALDAAASQAPQPPRRRQSH